MLQCTTGRESKLAKHTCGFLTRPRCGWSPQRPPWTAAPSSVDTLRSTRELLTFWPRPPSPAVLFPYFGQKHSQRHESAKLVTTRSGHLDATCRKNRHMTETIHLFGSTASKKVCCVVTFQEPWSISAIAVRSEEGKARTEPFCSAGRIVFPCT